MRKANTPDVQSIPYGMDDDDSSGCSSSESVESSRRVPGSFGEDSSSQPPQKASFRSQGSSSFESFNAGETNNNNNNTDNPAIASTESERQILLLMLLAQVCALHDPTPRTFTVHVLELYERGILDRESIGFLFDLGLVPHKNVTSPIQLLENNAEEQQQQQQQQNNQLQRSLPTVVDPGLARAQEASAIRSRLEREESRAPSFHHESSSEHSSSWGVDQHPLSLSRYQREFRQLRLLNSGSFGSVFQATNKMDGYDYAVKRIVFSESGYSNDAVSQVVREVRCLAQCDHPNIVRYHTSWLEPSWVTGSGTQVTSADELVSKQVQRRMLTDIHRMVNGVGEVSETTGASKYSFDESSYSHFTEWSSSRYENSTNNENMQLQAWHEPALQTPRENKPSYRYQMCFFIQMQLCKSTTLADWIRSRDPTTDPNHYDNAIDVFIQITKGLEHIHAVGIVHRDLKPSNCLLGVDGYFKVGDFGLSKILRQAKNSPAPSTDIVVYSSARKPSNHDEWEDPLTMGIGTASYCAPEQVNTNSYDSKADIFSLGLMLLEIFCTFGTEHERIHTFHDCRQGKVPDKLTKEYPEVARIILSCTKRNSTERPTARELLCNPILLQSHNVDQHKLVVQGLQGILQEKDCQIQKQQSELEEKDRIIQDLRRQMSQLSSNTSSSTTTTPMTTAATATATATIASTMTTSSSCPKTVNNATETFECTTTEIVESTSYSDGDY